MGSIGFLQGIYRGSYCLWGILSQTIVIVSNMEPLHSTMIWTMYLGDPLTEPSLCRGLRGLSGSRSSSTLKNPEP